MPNVVVDLDTDLHARLTQWAQEQQRPLPALTRDILAAAERVRANYDPRMDRSTRLDSHVPRWRLHKPCEELEPLIAMGKTTAPSYER